MASPEWSAELWRKRRAKKWSWRWPRPWVRTPAAPSARRNPLHARSELLNKPFFPGQPGRYTLREKFKDFERCMTPDERPLETLKKYGNQAREVQLILQLNKSIVWDEMGRVQVGRYQPCPPLRRKDPGARTTRRGSGSLILQRQSLPPLTCLMEEGEQKQEDLKRTKRKSLTLMEEALEWLEGLGKGKVYSTARDKQSKKRTDKRNRASLDLTLTVEKCASEQTGRGQVRGQKTQKSDLDHQTSCCIGKQTSDKEGKHPKKTQEARLDFKIDDEKNRLRETIIQQLLCLQDLQAQIAHTDKQMSELEERQKAKRAEEEACERLAEEQIKVWESELKAEEGYEKDLQRQFLELRAKAGECRAQLEGFRHRMEGFDFSGSPADAEVGADDEVSTGSTEDGNLVANVNRKLLPREDPNPPPPPQALVPPNQIKERRLTGPTEIKEWWTRWSETQNAQTQTKKVIHRSELTIYLGSTKV